MFFLSTVIKVNQAMLTWFQRKEMGRSNTELGLYNKSIDNLDTSDLPCRYIKMYTYISYTFLKYFLKWFSMVKGKNYANKVQ